VGPGDRLVADDHQRSVSLPGLDQLLLERAAALVARPSSGAVVEVGAPAPTEDSRCSLAARRSRAEARLATPPGVATRAATRPVTRRTIYRAVTGCRQDQSLGWKGSTYASTLESHVVHSPRLNSS